MIELSYVSCVKTNIWHIIVVITIDTSDYDRDSFLKYYLFLNSTSIIKIQFRKIFFSVLSKWDITREVLISKCSDYYS